MKIEEPIDYMSPVVKVIRITISSSLLSGSLDGTTEVTGEVPNPEEQNND